MECICFSYFDLVVWLEQWQAGCGCLHLQTRIPQSTTRESWTGQQMETIVLRRVWGRVWQQCRRRRGESCVFACDLQCVFHTFLKATLVFVRVLVCFMYVGNCAFVSAYGGLEWGGCHWGQERRGAWQFNTRCLKSVGLTGCHKTAWLMESLGMSSPAVLMNPKPTGLMKRAPFAKTVPRLDLHWPAPLPHHSRVGLHGDWPQESSRFKLSKGTKERTEYEESKQRRQRIVAHVPT